MTVQTIFNPINLPINFVYFDYPWKQVVSVYPMLKCIELHYFEVFFFMHKSYMPSGKVPPNHLPGESKL